MKEISANYSRRPTLSDIAKRANVSTWTVSQALRGSKSIGVDTIDRIVKIAAEIGYRPNQAARALVSSKSNMVAIWLQASDRGFSSYYAQIQYHLQYTAREYGYQCIAEEYILDEHLNPDFTKLLNWAIDGVILCDVPDIVKLRNTVDPNGLLPMVTIGSWEVSNTVDNIEIDLFPGSVSAVKHLLASGCNRIAFVSPMPFDTRYQAYEKIIHEAGKQTECIIVSHNNRKSAITALREFIETHGMPDGLFCQNDDFAIACYKCLCDMGIRVPEDVCIVGCDGIRETEYLPAKISTLIIPMHQIASTAMKFLRNRMENPGLSLQKELVTPQLEIRDSSSR